MVSSLPQTVPGPALLLGLEAFLSLFFYPYHAGSLALPTVRGTFLRAQQAEGHREGTHAKRHHT
jgi:hypothetical protein